MIQDLEKTYDIPSTRE